MFAQLLGGQDFEEEDEDDSEGPSDDRPEKETDFEGEDDEDDGDDPSGEKFAGSRKVAPVRSIATEIRKAAESDDVLPPEDDA